MNERLRVRFVAVSLILGIALLAASLPLAARGGAGKDAATSTVIVHVTGIRNAKGKIGVALFANANGFPEEVGKSAAQKWVPIESQSLDAEAIFEHVPPGVYAVTALHDENANGKLDKGRLGIPREGYGVSNNPPKRMRPPRFDEAKITVDRPECRVEIKLIYW